MDDLISIEKPQSFSLRVANADENWRILNSTGITWLAEDQCDEEMDVIVYNEKNFKEVKSILETLSFRPYLNS